MKHGKILTDAENNDYKKWYIDKFKPTTNEILINIELIKQWQKDRQDEGHEIREADRT